MLEIHGLTRQFKGRSVQLDISRLTCAPARTWPSIQGERLIPERGMNFRSLRCVVQPSLSLNHLGWVPLGRGGCIHEVDPDA